MENTRKPEAKIWMLRELGGGEKRARIGGSDAPLLPFRPGAAGYWGERKGENAYSGAGLPVY